MLVETVGWLNEPSYQAMILERVRLILPVVMTVYHLLIGPLGNDPSADLSKLDSWNSYPLDTAGYMPEQDFGNWRERTINYWRGENKQIPPLITESAKEQVDKAIDEMRSNGRNIVPLKDEADKFFRQ